MCLQATLYQVVHQHHPGRGLQVPNPTPKGSQQLSANSGYGPDPSALCTFLMVNPWLEHEIHCAEQAVVLTAIDLPGSWLRAGETVSICRRDSEISLWTQNCNRASQT